MRWHPVTRFIDIPINAMSRLDEGSAHVYSGVFRIVQ